MTSRIHAQPSGNRLSRSRVHRDGSGRRVTEGRRQLCRIASMSTARELAARLNISCSFLCELMGGEHRPSLDLAIRMVKLLGIPAESWG